MGKVNFSTANAQVSDEVLNVSSSAAVNLRHDVFYNKTSKLVIVRTAAAGGGTLLVAGTDYNISGAVVDGDLPESITPDVAYTTIAIINATYQNVDLYITYYPIMDYWEVEDIVQLIQGTDLADKDISAATQTTDLTVYEPGGASALQDGAIVNVSWSGGDTTYAHKFSVTSGWTIAAISGPNLAPGDNSSTFAWCGYGTGFLKLKLDIANKRWIVLSGIGGGGCFDKGSFSRLRPSGTNGGYVFEQMTNGTLKQSWSIAGAATVQTFVFLIPFKDIAYRCSDAVTNKATTEFLYGINSINKTVSQIDIAIVAIQDGSANVSFSVTGEGDLKWEGEWRD